MPSRAIIGSAAWQIASQIVMAALSVATVKFVALGLSKELAGNYNSAYGFLQLFGIVADFGLYAVSVREMSATKRKVDVLATLIVLRLIILAVSLTAAISIVWVLPQWRGTPLPLGVTIASLVPLFTLLAGILRTVFQVTYTMQYVFVAEVAQRILTASGIGLVVLLGLRSSDDVFYYYLFLLIGGIGALLLLSLSFIFASRLMPLRLRWSGSELSSLFKRASPYGIAFLCIALYRQFDITMIALLRPDYEIQNAYYGFAGRIIEMTYLIPTYLLNSVLPAISGRAWETDSSAHVLGKTFALTVLCGAVSLVFCLLWARPLIQLLTSSRYLSSPGHVGSDTALMLLSLPALLNGIVLFCFYVLLARDEWKRLVATMLVAVFTSLLSNVLLVPPLGFVGAGITAIIVNTLLVVLLLPQTLRLTRISLPPNFWGKLWLFILPLSAMLWLSARFMVSSPRIVLGLLLATAVMGALAGATRLDRTLLATTPLGKEGKQ